MKTASHGLASCRVAISKPKEHRPQFFELHVELETMMLWEIVCVVKSGASWQFRLIPEKNNHSRWL